ncbi:hypothetical protein GmRootV213_30440 [Variovorax sp. V213]|uniref:hypothetical protein n=1 Tax=Variovorax sp. V213 TaxID=3065955 RepID=UPI0034E8D99A
MDFEGIYCFDTATVRFAIYPDGRGGARIIAQISEETLHDVFGTRNLGDRLLDTCKTHFDALSAAALRCHRANPKAPINLTVDDFSPCVSPGSANDSEHDATAGAPVAV